MSSVDGIILGQYLLKKKRYKTMIGIGMILVLIGFFMTISGIIEKRTWDRLQVEGVTTTATCYSIERNPMSNKKYNKRAYWEWEYNGIYYGEDVGASEAEKQLAEIGKTCTVYIDSDNPEIYILATEWYNPIGTMLIGLAVFVVFDFFELMMIISISCIKKRDKKLENEKDN